MRTRRCRGPRKRAVSILDGTDNHGAAALLRPIEGGQRSGRDDFVSIHECAVQVHEDEAVERCALRRYPSSSSKEVIVRSCAKSAPSP